MFTVKRDQDWFDKKYSKKIQKVTEISERILGTTKLGLEGSLKIVGFTKLEKISLEKHKLTSLEIINCSKLTQIDLVNFFSSSLTELKIDNCSKLDSIKFNSGSYFSSASEISLFISNCPELVKLECNHKKLVKLELNSCPKLAILDCSYNLIKSLILNDCFELIKLNCSSNKLDNLDVSNCPKLAEARCNYNKLTSIYINNTSTKVYPENIRINCKSKEELIINSLRIETSEMKENPKKFGEKESWDEINNIRSSSFSASDLNSEEENKLEVELEWKSEPVFKGELKESNNKGGSMNYHSIHPEYFFPQDFDDGWADKLTELPTKLIDVKRVDKESLKAKETDIIIVKDEVKKGAEIKDYAILSYSWSAAPWGKFRKDNRKFNSLLHAGSKKSFRKAVKACKGEVGINYLWMDVLCIDQSNERELTRELAKVRQYYSNAKVTLIAIQSDLIAIQGDKDVLESLEAGSNNLESIFSTASDIIWVIFKSDWFKRSWTFQEGLLSRQTIFMFDDYLIDGRLLAMAWSIKKIPKDLSTLTKSGGLEDFLKNYSKKVATPLGWAYYHDGYNAKDTVYLNLFQALEAIKDRKRYIAVDGIYSIIGLLPYEVKPNYKVELWGDVKYNYSKEEVVESLVEVMKVAVKNGHGEPLSWYGESNKLTGYCWLPEILVDNESTDKNGSMKIERVIKDVKCCLDSVIFTEKKIRIRGSKYDIISKENVIGNDGDKWFKTNLLLGIKIKGSYENKHINIRGTRKTLEKIKEEETLLLVPSKIQWMSRLPVALLVESNNDRTYHRIDLLEILEGFDHLTSREEDLIIGTSGCSETNSYIEIPSKQ